MNKLTLKAWLEAKIEMLEFRKKISETPLPEIDPQIKILKELYDDFNLESVNPIERFFTY